MNPIPLHTAKSLLETYVRAKDNNRPELIHEAFAQDATLTISINTDTIAFPAKTEGAQGIAATLVTEFAKTFDACRTYYVADELALVGDSIVVPWLVAMRETAANVLRLGKGYYRWGFAQADGPARIASLHIHIERMDSVADPMAATLAALQAGLTYPWLPADELKTEINRLVAAKPSLAFLQAFAEPVPLP
ncbi:hypothetical protein AB4Z48_13710 [Cupriavidus sp. 2TAF22]|uniref:hypothetical protein n=1 Tax=unclassified Cupriavidus TaxID=2640874 RepID=UPI003F929051